MKAKRKIPKPEAWMLKVFWNLFSFFYDSVRDLWPYKELMRKVADDLILDSRSAIALLDVGCGTGNLLLEIKSRNRLWNFWGIDRSLSMLRRAERKVGKGEFLLGDINNTLPILDNSLDAITLVNVLYSVSLPSGLIDECHRVLKFDGILIVANPRRNAKISSIILAHVRAAGDKGLRWLYLCRALAANSRFVFLTGMNLVVKFMNRRRKFHFMDGSELKDELIRGGFQLVKLELAYADTDVLAVARKTVFFDSELGKIQALVAHTQADIGEIHGLRYEVYCLEMGSLNLENYPGKQEWDDYDPYSIIIMIKLGVEIIGTLRLVKDSRLGFVMEDGFTIPSSVDRSGILEHSRGIIKKNYRDNGLYKFIWLAAKEWQKPRGYNICIGAAGVGKFSKILENLGWEYTGEAPKIYHNTLSVPMIYILK